MEAERLQAEDVSQPRNRDEPDHRHDLHRHADEEEGVAGEPDPKDRRPASVIVVARRYSAPAASIGSPGRQPASQYVQKNADNAKIASTAPRNP